MSFIEICPHCGEPISFVMNTSPDKAKETKQTSLQQLDLTLIRRVGSQLGQFGEDGCFLGWLE